jgi:type II secretory pathway predicted ATPase ExeA
MTPVQSRWDDQASRQDSDRSRENLDVQRASRVASRLLYRHFGLTANPFGVTPNPRFLYESKTHAEARSSLILGIECGVGFQALIAPPGMGKTTILFKLLEHFRETARTAFVFQNQGDSADFLRYVIKDLGAEAHGGSDLMCLQDIINDLLLRERREGRRTILIIDEAQNLSASVLETVRLLSNFETPDEKLLQIILTGQPELAQRLAQPQAAQLYQRISILATLTPFGLADTNNYVEHRLKIAGYQGSPLFTQQAMQLIWQRSSGVPRQINTLCFNALLLALASNQKCVDAPILQEVIAGFDLNQVRTVVQIPAYGLGPDDPVSDLEHAETVSSLEGEYSGPFVQETEPDATSEQSRPVFMRDRIPAEPISSAAHFITRQTTQENPLADSEATDIKPALKTEGAVGGVIADSTNGTVAASASPAEPSEQLAPAKLDLKPELQSNCELEADIVADEQVMGSQVKSKDSALQSDLPIESSSEFSGHDQPGAAPDSKAGENLEGAKTDSRDLIGKTENISGVRHVESDWVLRAEAAFRRYTSGPQPEEDFVGRNNSWELAAEQDGKSDLAKDQANAGKHGCGRNLEPKSREAESRLENSSAAVANAPLRIIPAASSRTSSSQLPWTHNVSLTLKEKWRDRKSTIYLAASALILLLIILSQGAPPSSKSSLQPDLAFGERLLVFLGFAESPSRVIYSGNPNVQVWVDVPNAVYYCPSADQYGKTRGGRFVRQGDAQLRRFKPADRRACP